MNTVSRDVLVMSTGVGMRHLRKLTLALGLSLTSVACPADDPISEEWSRLIKADFPPGCVSRADEYLSSIGSNGIRTGAWLVQTCQGNFEYGAGYVPDDARSGKWLVRVRRHQAVRELTAKQLEMMYGIGQ